VYEQFHARVAREQPLGAGAHVRRLGGQFSVMDSAPRCNSMSMQAGGSKVGVGAVMHPPPWR